MKSTTHSQTLWTLLVALISMGLFLYIHFDQTSTASSGSSDFSSIPNADKVKTLIKTDS